MKYFPYDMPRDEALANYKVLVAKYDPEYGPGDARLMEVINNEYTLYNKYGQHYSTDIAKVNAERFKDATQTALMVEYSAKLVLPKNKELHTKFKKMITDFLYQNNIPHTTRKEKPTA